MAPNDTRTCRIVSLSDIIRSQDKEGSLHALFLLLRCLADTDKWPRGEVLGHNVAWWALSAPRMVDRALHELLSVAKYNYYNEIE